MQALEFCSGQDALPVHDQGLKTQRSTPRCTNLTWYEYICAVYGSYCCHTYGAPPLLTSLRPSIVDPPGTQSRQLTTVVTVTNLDRMWPTWQPPVALMAAWQAESLRSLVAVPWGTNANRPVLSPVFPTAGAERERELRQTRTSSRFHLNNNNNNNSSYAQADRPIIRPTKRGSLSSPPSVPPIAISAVWRLGKHRQGGSAAWPGRYECAVCDASLSAARPHNARLELQAANIVNTEEAAGVCQPNPGTSCICAVAA
ncbi:predicted protein [Plenodomus lingam JN3]|uniref:Predicted protein n=1 Tax=Leptosphaeria maculans (strain JN3 / isolate v23.1.3 / race Av1-4-5-6-7-8) TaxID=985895 RepID=E5AB14_LEPMJ|nr:predicted protein [Plenodomus lingam JN3]CBY00855.1 predicted protein [Plenodomus lingam JN3]